MEVFVFFALLALAVGIVWYVIIPIILWIVVFIGLLVAEVFKR